MSRSAPRHPDKFFIGIDANVKPLAKSSLRLERKPSKGGAPNAMFVQAAVEDLPEEFTGIATEIHIQFPWGSLLKVVTTGDEKVLSSLRRMSMEGSRLNILVAIDEERDASELARLSVPSLTTDHIRLELLPRYEEAGFSRYEVRELTRREWLDLDTTWSKKLSGGARRALLLGFRAT